MTLVPSPPQPRTARQTWLSWRSLPLLLLLLALTALALWLGAAGKSWLTLERLAAWHAEGMRWQAQNPVLTAAAYFVGFIGISIVPLPILRVGFAVLGGALFGAWLGVALVSVASMLGASIAFLLARHALRNWLERRYRPFMQLMQDGLRQNGWLHLFSLRLVPIVPYSAVNIACGLTRMPLWQFALTSQLAMLPLITLYVNAGGQLAQLQSLQDLISPRLLLVLILLALAPWLLRAAGAWLLRRGGRVD